MRRLTILLLSILFVCVTNVHSVFAEGPVIRPPYCAAWNEKMPQQSLNEVDYLVLHNPQNPYEYSVPSQAFVDAQVYGDRDGNGKIEICVRGGDEEIGQITYSDNVSVSTNFWQNVPNNGVGTGYEDVYLFTDGAHQDYTRILPAQGGTSIFEFYGSNSGREFNVRGFTVSGGTANRGGAFNLFGSQINLQSLNLFGNNAEVQGGALYADQSVVQIKDVISKNNSSFQGGAMAFHYTTTRHEKLEFAGNSAVDGGSIYSYHTDIDQFKTAYSNSIAADSSQSQGEGGVVYLNAGNFISEDVQFSNTYAVRRGGNIFATNSAYVLLDKGTVKLTSSTDGGAIYAEDSSRIFIDNLSISDTSANDGGYAYLKDSELHFLHSGVSHSTAGRFGGVIYAESSLVDMNQFSFADVSASVDGGGVYVIDMDNLDGLGVANGSVVNSEAVRAGGFLYVESLDGNLNVNSVNIDNVHAGNTGGVFRVWSTSGASALAPNFSNVSVTNSGTLNQIAEGGVYSCRNMTKSTMTNVFFENVASSAGGGIIIYNCNTSILNGAFINNDALSNSGGAVYSNFSNLDIDNVFFSDSDGTQHGGAIYFSGGDLAITDSTFEANQASNAGAIYVLNTDLELDSVEFFNNIANDPYTAHGGAVSLHSSTLTGNDLYFANNEANINSLSLLSRGGAIYGSLSSLVEVDVVNSHFVDNEAHTGGAIFLDGVNTLDIDNTHFENNTSVNGGAIYMSSLDANISGSTFEGNSVTSRGGGVRMVGVDLNLSETEFIDNSAELGGGGLSVHSSTLNGNEIEFVDNFSGVDGGGLLVQLGSVIIDDVLFEGNEAINAGGGAAFGGQVDANQVVFFNNRAADAGALFATSGDHNLTNSIIYDNYSTDLTGAMNHAVYAFNASLALDHVVIAGNGRQSQSQSTPQYIIDGNFHSVIDMSNSYIGNNKSGALIDLPTGSSLNFFVTDSLVDFLADGLAAFNSGTGNFVSGADFLGDGVTTDPMQSTNLGLFDFHLQSVSALIDAGDPDPFYNDVDGTRSDVGAYGGPNGVW